MKLYIDESGNTGETLSRDGKFNFKNQPYYVLSGIFLSAESKSEIEVYVSTLKAKYYVQGIELKSKGIYSKKPEFLIDLIHYIIDNKIPVFTELMDKLFFIHTQLIEYFIIPFYSMEVTEQNVEGKRIAASELGKYLNEKIYDEFISALKGNTNQSLEAFYEILISHFDHIGEEYLKKNVEMTKDDYFEEKEVDSTKAFEKFFPIPDKNPSNRLIHLLPNYNAFTNLIARTQKYVVEHTGFKSFSIIHDEQKQFDVIYEAALNSMKVIDTDSIVEGSDVKMHGTYNIDENIDLNFEDSKADISIQIADLLSGFVMRFWLDFKSGNKENVDKYLPLILKLNRLDPFSSIGINYVVPYLDFIDVHKRLREISIPNNA